VSDSTPSFWATNWADILSVIGFFVTVVAVLKARSAAESAEDAAKKARQALLHFDSIANCSTAVNLMEEIKRLNRANSWDPCLDRLATVQRTLSALKASETSFKEDDLTVIQSAIGQVAEVEAKIEKTRMLGRAPDIARLNEVISKQIEKVHGIQMKLKQHTNEESL
jgi:hypothetical protein